MTATAARPVAVKLDTELQTRIKRLAQSRQRTPHWLMKEAIRDYVDREEKRESFRQDALQAWAAYEATGVHATFEEADAWLARLEAGEDVDLPECHV
jgi:predicted transcriptional regulator